MRSITTPRMPPSPEAACAMSRETHGFSFCRAAEVECGDGWRTAETAHT
jgi:hypothetical protein